MRNTEVRGHTMYDVITFGECMLRFSSPGHQMLEQAARLHIDPAGTESNVAVALVRLGMRVAWWSALSDTPIGRWITGRLEAHGVDTSHVVWTNDRTGVFFLEPGRLPRGSRVVYDRADSAVSRLKPADMDWGLTAQTRLLHLSGITPALSDTCRDIVAQGLEAAQAHACRTSFDINYRAKLWSPANASRVLTPLLKRVDILISTEPDVRLLFDINGPPEDMINRLQDRFQNAIIVITLAEGGAVGWSEASGFLRTEPHPVEQVDRLGAGDAFDAGLLYGILNEDIELGLLCGTALAATSYSERGDVTWATRPEILRLAGRDGSSCTSSRGI